VKRRLTAPAVLLASAALALAASGCGGAAAGSGGHAFGDAAKAVPAHSLAFVDLNLDRSSTAWQQAQDVGRRFPSWNRFVANVQREIDKPSGGLRYTRDIQPWLGGEAGVAVTGVNISSNAHPVDFLAFAAVKDDGAASKAVAKGATGTGSFDGFSLFRDRKSSTLAAVGHNAVLFSNDMATLHNAANAWTGDAPRLADDPSYRRAMSALPADSLVTAYVDAHRLGTLVSLAALSQLHAQAPGMANPFGAMSKVFAGLDSISGALGADGGGVRLTINVAPSPGHTVPAALMAAANSAPVLMDRVPASAFAYLGGTMPSLSRGLSGTSMQAFQQVPQLAALAPLLSGKFAAYASPGMPVTGAVMLAPTHLSAALAAMPKLTAELGAAKHVHFHWLPGHRGQVAQVGPGIRIGWRHVGDTIVISNDPSAGAVQSAGLGTSAAFTTFAHQAGIPGRVSSLFYLDVHRLMGVIPGVPASADAAHLGGFAVWSSVDSSGAHFSAYLQVTR
jgi:hypothetical protein